MSEHHICQQGNIFVQVEGSGPPRLGTIDGQVDYRYLQFNPRSKSFPEIP